MEKMGVIGGSGLYDLEGLTVKEELVVDTPFGRPSGPLLVAEIFGKELVFLPRHGPGHRFSPSNLPYQANIYALKKLGVTQLLSVSAVGSMKEDIVPGHLVFVDQYIDRTVSRPRTFFEDEIVGHVAFGDPICKDLQQAALKAARRVDGVTVHEDGTYICIEGPQFSTRAESELFRTWGVSVIGMTNLPEARLAREAEMSYITMALVTDFDCWHQGHDDVTVEGVIETLRTNVANAKKVIVEWARDFDPSQERTSPAASALKNAVMTDPSQMTAKTREKLALLLNKYF